MLIGDFNLTFANEYLETLVTTFHMENLIKSRTCFQSKNPRCIYLILTNQKNFFKDYNVSRVGISDYHGIIVSTLKGEFIKGNPKIRPYRNYRNFDIEAFKQDRYDILKAHRQISKKRVS